MKREYEIGLIINPETTDEEVEKIKTSITDILEKGKGTIENLDEWGRKALAYPIEKHNEGIYLFIKTMSPGDVIAAVERRLKLNEKVMRFIVIRLDDKLKKTNKLEKQWKKAEKFSRKPAGDPERDRSSERAAVSTPDGDKKEDDDDRTIDAPAIKKPAAVKKSEEKVETEPAPEISGEEEATAPAGEEADKKAVKKTEKKADTEDVKKETSKTETGKKETKKEKKETKPEDEEEAVKPKKTTAKKTTKKAEENADEEVENAETK